jgi:hypothetical protein
MRSIIALGLLLTASVAWAGEAHDVRGWNPQTDANDVIDAKCKSCHSRQQVDSAFAKKDDIEAVIRRMEGKGVKLSSKEKEVLGIFSRGPFKQK